MYASRKLAFLKLALPQLGPFEVGTLEVGATEARPFEDGLRQMTPRRSARSTFSPFRTFFRISSAVKSAMGTESSVRVDGNVRRLRERCLPCFRCLAQVALDLLDFALERQSLELSQTDPLLRDGREAP